MSKGKSSSCLVAWQRQGKGKDKPRPTLNAYVQEAQFCGGLKMQGAYEMTLFDSQTGSWHA